MKSSNKVSIGEIVQVIVFFAFLAGMCFLFSYGCSQHEQQNSARYRSEYIGYYGNVFNRYTIEFDTYEVQSGRYIFYDNNGLLVADVPIEGNNLSVMKRP